MIYIIYILIALLPSTIWLLWYLRKDKHPEPNIMILRVFIWGMLIAFPAILLENGFISLVQRIPLNETLKLFIIFFLGVAVIEELLKFFVVKFRVLRTTHLDEPTDAMIYMIIAALGFAAIENILILTPLFADNFVPTLGVVFSRFIGATLLHVLASSIIGYYLALSLFQPQKKFPLLIHGFTLAVILHGFYNIFVVQLSERTYLIIPLALLLISTAILISIFFKNLSKMKSISVIK